jgi:hypothetical protein
VAGYNLVPIGDEVQAPRGMGAGLSVGDDRRFHLAGDWRRDFERTGKGTDSWMAGAEILLGDTAPVRGGFLKDGTRGARFWSAGVGLVSSSGVALDVSYRQSVEAPFDRTVALAIKIFVHAAP